MPFELSKARRLGDSTNKIEARVTTVRDHTGHPMDPHENRSKEALTNVTTVAFQAIFNKIVEEDSATGPK